MKKNFLTKITATVLVVLMVLSFCACAGNPQEANQYPKNGERKIITTNKNIYLPNGQLEPINVAHYENESEILMIEVNCAVKTFFTEMFANLYPNFSITVNETDTTVTFTRENGAYCEIDFVKDTVFFSDFDMFSMKGYGVNPHDSLATAYKNVEGEDRYFKRETSFYTPGYSIEIDLAERNIPLDIYGGKKYIPMQTFNDLFISSHGINIAYNGEDLFFMNGNTLSPEVAEIYYGREKALRSKALAEFNYNELCLSLDLYYGLQEEHKFDNGFTYYLESVGLKDLFLELDAINSFNALANLTLGYIADLHSATKGASPYLGEEKPSSGIDAQVAPGVLSYTQNSEIYTTVREEQMGEVLFYQKIGDTAYVTIDTFTLGDRMGDYDETSMQIEDTLSIIMIAHAQITQDEEIKNVVVDLSCNGGGAIDSMVYLVAWMLGSCEVSIYNNITQSKGSMSYNVDVNLDGQFDENDTISDKNLYCIVYPASFSCGNYAPALLKASGRVTIIGKTSSGGACFVRNTVSADGTLYSISSPYQMSIVKNGSYYSVDSGVEPDIALTKIESFYDRVALTEYLKKIK